MNKEIREQIFYQYPEVKLAFREEVPRNYSEQEFWKRFFVTYIIEQQEKLVSDGFSVLLLFS